MKIPKLLTAALFAMCICFYGCTSPAEKPTASSQPEPATTLQEECFDLKDLSVQPFPRKRVPPKYPKNLKIAGIGGEVLLGTVLDTSGQPTQIRVIRSTHPEFTASAIEALNQWRWAPGQRKGRFVPCRIEQPFVFAISNH